MTLVPVVPLGLGLPTYMSVLLSPYSRFPPVSFDELSARPRGASAAMAAPAPWAAEGLHVRCFERVSRSAHVCALRACTSGSGSTS